MEISLSFQRFSGQHTADFCRFLVSRRNKECLRYLAGRFAEQIEKPTTIIIDNASIHTSDEFNSHIEGWEKKDLKVYRLPTYSPELNIIEIVWRKIKYDWLPFDAYKSFADLKRELFDVLANIGISYNVDFS